MLLKLVDVDLTSNRCINTRATTSQQLYKLNSEMDKKCTTIANQIATANYAQDAQLRQNDFAKLAAEIKTLKETVTQCISTH